MRLNKKFSKSWKKALTTLLKNDILISNRGVHPKKVVNLGYYKIENFSSKSQNQNRLINLIQQF